MNGAGKEATMEATGYHPKVVGWGMMLLAVVGAPAITAAELTIHVTNLRAPSGDLYLAIYDNESAFPSEEGQRAGMQVKVEDAEARVVFRGLTQGAYAVAMFHDQNGNGEFDTGLLGLPMEGFGFSNDVSVLLGPPAFEEARVLVPPEGARISVRMQYLEPSLREIIASPLN